ncbi:MAG: hypothetical protein ACRDY0_11730 [Acidimicrobiales bacterium]
MIGDPSGKSDERNLLATEVLSANSAAVEAQVRMFIDTTRARGW